MIRPLPSLALNLAGLYAGFAALLILIFWGCLHGLIVLWLPWVAIFPSVAQTRINMGDTLLYTFANVLIVYFVVSMIGKAFGEARARRSRRPG